MKKFLNRFTLIFTSILALICTYIGLRNSTGALEWAFVLLPALLLWMMPILVWSSEADQFARHEILFQQLSFFSMGWMSWLLVLTIARDLILGATWAFSNQAREIEFAAQSHGTPVFVIAAAVTAYGAWIGFRGPRIHEIEVPIEGLPESLVGLKIAQISDLHVGPTIGRAYVQKVVDRVREINPDITVFTGDIIDGNLLDLRSSLEPFRELTSRGRIFFATGNHEYYWGFEEWMNEFRALGMELLLNRGVSLDHRGSKVYVAGVTDPAAIQNRRIPTGQGDGPSIPAVTEGASHSDFHSASFRLLLSHRPNPINESAARAGFHLQLSGHTHGGQFFPWTIAVKFFHTHVIGLHRFEKLWVYVSPGTGSWGPPLRIGTTPEVTRLALSNSLIKIT